MRISLPGLNLGNPLEREAQHIFDQFIDLVRSRLLLFQSWLGAILSVIFLWKLLLDTWIMHQYTPIYAILFALRIPVPLLIVHIFLKHQRIMRAWVVYIVLNQLAILVVIDVTSNPHALIFGLFSTMGAAIVLPFWLVILLMGAIFGITYVALLSVFQNMPNHWASSMLIYASIMASGLCMGLILQFMLRRFAVTVLAQQRDALDKETQRASAEQQLIDLRLRLRQFSLINHDLRQPLRIIEGHLRELETDPTDDTELIQPALAATQRAERLLNNLLDQFRAEAGQHHRLYNPRLTDLNTLLAEIAASLPGLARYHSDSIARLTTDLHPLPPLHVDAEHLERAMFNLLDNAMLYAAHRVALRAYVEHAEVVLEVEDDGPGLDASLYRILTDSASLTATARSGFGLAQVRAMVDLHHGTLHIIRLEQGLRMQIRLVLPNFSPDSSAISSPEEAPEAPGRLSP